MFNREESLLEERVQATTKKMIADKINIRFKWTRMKILNFNKR